MSDPKAGATRAPRPRGGPGGHGRGPIVAGEKPKEFGKTLRRLLERIGRLKGRVIVVMILAALATVFSVLGPRILGLATTSIFSGLTSMVEGTGSGIDMAYVGQIIALLLAVYVASALFMYLQGFIMAEVTRQVTYQMRVDISHKINQLPLSYFDKHGHGEVMSLLTNDIDTLTQTLNQGLTQVVTSLVTIIGITVVMFTMNWLLTLIVMLMLPVCIVVVSLIVKKSQKHFMAQQTYLGHLNAHVEETYGSHMVVKAFNGEGEAIEAFDSLNGTLYESAWKSQFISGIMMPLMTFIGNLAYVVIVLLGGYMALHGTITIGEIQAFLQYVRNYSQPIVQLAQLSTVLQSALAAAERVFTFLDEPNEAPDTTHPIPIEHATGKVQFEHVRFGYDPAEPIIKDFSTNVTPGQKVAIVGPTGAGKTTLVKLLMRFYDINSGEIQVDSIDTMDMTRDELRSQFGMVLQDAWLENATIRENIRYGKLDATDEEVVQAAKTAQVDHFVRTLPEGYNTVIDEESSNISQGQKQLITIARVVLADPDMLILDEATSSVDTRTEMQIQKAMDRLMKGRTSFIIAHRLSTIRDADLILVMNEGDVVEQGTHEELLAKKGFYADLYYSQFEQQAAS